MENGELLQISVDNLIHYNNHPFKLHTGQRFTDMVESIMANGLYQPLIIRPIANADKDTAETHEVLSGHNRLEAAKEAGLKFVPCVSREDISDDEALIIVLESNLVQRSFADLPHSERARVLTEHYNVIKRQGKRSGFVSDIQALLSEQEVTALSQVETKGRPTEIVGEIYGLEKDTVARYIRLNSLIEGLKELLDTGDLSLGAGYNLSFLDEGPQDEVLAYITENEAKITLKQSKELKELAANGSISRETVKEVFEGKSPKSSKPKKTVSIRYKRKDIEKYFAPDATEEQISDTVLEALEFYKTYKDKITVSINGALSQVETEAFAQSDKPLENEEAEPTEPNIDNLTEEQQNNIYEALADLGL